MGPPYATGCALSVRPPYPLVVFDLDGTLVDQREPIWKTLHERLGSDPGRRRATIEAALAGTLSYADWFQTDLEMLREAGATRGSIEAIVDAIEPTPGAIELVASLRAAGAAVALVSGGIDMIRARILPQVHFDAVYINAIHFGDDGTIVGGKPTAYDRDHKVSAIRKLALDRGLSMKETAFVGDGSNDIYAAREVGCSIAWGATAHPGLIAVCDHHVVEPHMDALRPLLMGEVVIP